MISYRGDKYVTGKKFIIENETYTFKRRSKNGLVFESCDNKIKVFTEDYLTKQNNKKMIMEKVKQEVSELSIKEGRVLSKKELQDIVNKYQVQ
jgi:hypothetical protein